MILFLEGGKAGHINHPYEDSELSFSQIKKIFQLASNGELIGSIKLDGMNLYLSFSVPKNQVLVARNNSDINSGGVTKDQISERYKDNPLVQKSFLSAIDIFQNFCSNFNKQELLSIFGPNADNFFNCEILDPKNPNVIRYKQFNVVFHNNNHSIKSGTSEEKLNGLKKLVSRLPQSVIKFDRIQKLPGIQNKQTYIDTISLIQSLQRKFNVSDNDKVSSVPKNELEPIVQNFACEILKGISSNFPSIFPAEQLKNNIDFIKTRGNSEDIIRLNSELSRFKGTQAIKEEGFVFFFNGRLYKFTGNFAPINQIFNLCRNVRQIAQNPSNIKFEGHRAISESVSKGRTIALVPGGFKPPHIGHLNMVERYAQMADKVLIFVSPGQRENIAAEQSIQLWNLYLQTSEYKDKIFIRLSSVQSPIQMAYLFLANENNDPNWSQPGDTIILGVSSKQGDDTTRFSNSNKYARPGVKVIYGASNVMKPTIDPKTGKEFSSTDMRKTIYTGDVEEFSRFLPVSLRNNAAEILKMLNPRFSNVKQENISFLEQLIRETLEETIRKKGSEWCLYSKKSHKNLGCSPSRSGAEKRERQVQYFKHLNEEMVPLENSLGLNRKGLPQLSPDTIIEFRKFASQKGVNSAEEQINNNDLQPIQRTFDDEKVKAFLSIYQEALKKALLVSQDNYIIDGHHRWMAQRTANPDAIVTVVKIYAPLKECLLLLDDFFKTTHAGIEQ